MKTKLLLTMLFSIGIIGITSAQGYAKNDNFGGPRKTVVIKHEPRRTVMVNHRISRHERRKMRRMERRHQRRMVVRHHRHF